MCPCVKSYYRAPGEEDLPCTRKSLEGSMFCLSKNVQQRSSMVGLLSVVIFGITLALISFLKQAE